MIIQLPWPPSLNKYWRHARGRHYITPAGLEYREHAWAAYVDAGQPPPLLQRLAVIVRAHPPNRIRRDLDNLLKCPLDALQHACFYKDDSQIDYLQITRESIIAGGKLVVELSLRGEVNRELCKPAGNDPGSNGLCRQAEARR